MRYEDAAKLDADRDRLRAENEEVAKAYAALQRSFDSVWNACRASNDRAEAAESALSRLRAAVQEWKEACKEAYDEGLVSTHRLQQAEKALRDLLTLTPGAAKA